MNEHPIQDGDITLYGAGGHCKVVIDVLESQGKRVGLVVDDNPKCSSFMSFPCTAPLDSYDRTIVTIGDCVTRKKIVGRISTKHYEKAIHSTAVVSARSKVGEGTVVMHGAVVQSCASVGSHCIINTHSAIEHDSVVQDFVHVASGAIISGGVEIGECTLIGAGSVVKHGIRIGKNCLIGAGSVVVKDIPDNSVAYGNPCRVVRKV